MLVFGIGKITELFRTCRILAAKPQIHATDSSYLEPYVWTKITGSFVADKDYTHICIGQFQPTSIDALNGYIAIDDVYLSINKPLKLEAGKALILENICFKSGTAILETRAFASLLELAEVLKNEPSVKRSINGHTVDVGTAAKNQVLSLNRAQAVMDFLKEKGIAEERLTALGFGASKPIASNEQEAGRLQNRRVEFVVLE